MYRFLGFVLTFFLFAPAAVGEDSTLQRLDTGDDGRDWEAVGRLDIGGRGFCTGALIAPDLVLTAAHCLYDRDTGQPFEVEDIEFLSGWRNGRASAYRTVRRALQHPKYNYSNDVTAERVRHDIALLQLDHPIVKAWVEPYLTHAQPKKRDQIGIVSYARDRSEAPSLQQACQVLDRQDGVLIMSCEVNFGASGAPVFSFEDGKPRIVSVVSAMAERDGKKVALGAQLDQPLTEMRAALDTGVAFNSNRTRLFSSGKNRETGAKFASPDAE